MSDALLPDGFVTSPLALGATVPNAVVVKSLMDGITATITSTVMNSVQIDVATHVSTAFQFINGSAIVQVALNAASQATQSFYWTGSVNRAPGAHSAPDGYVFSQSGSTGRTPYYGRALGDALKTLEELRDYEDDWAGEDTYAPSAPVIATTQELLLWSKDLVPAPAVMPVENGTVSLEWSTSLGYASLDVGEDSFALIIRREGGKSVYRNGNSHELTPSVLREIDQALFRSPFATNSFSHVELLSAGRVSVGQGVGV